MHQKVARRATRTVPNGMGTRGLPTPFTAGGHRIFFSGCSNWLGHDVRLADAKCGSRGYDGVDVRQLLAIDNVRDRFGVAASLVDVTSALHWRVLSPPDCMSPLPSIKLLRPHVGCEQSTGCALWHNRISPQSFRCTSSIAAPLATHSPPPLPTPQVL